MIVWIGARIASASGHDFRPDYLRIGELRTPRWMCRCRFTRPADAETQAEIIQSF